MFVVRSHVGRRVRAVCCQKNGSDCFRSAVFLTVLDPVSGGPGPRSNEHSAGTRTDALGTCV